MSDWLEQLSELEQRATKGKWYVVGAPWGDGTIVIAGNPDPHVGEYICDTDDALVMDDEQAKEHGSCNSIADAEFIAALRNNASEMIDEIRYSRAEIKRLREELENARKT